MAKLSSVFLCFAVGRSHNVAGRVLAELSPAADGGFSYRATAPVEHVLVVRSGDGHRAEWVVRAAELAPAFAGRSADQSATEAALGMHATHAHRPLPVAVQAAVQASGPLPQDVAAAAVAPSGINPALIAAMELAVARQLRPLREELAVARSRARLRDLLGGIGYIFGLAGLALWWRARGASIRADPVSGVGRQR